MGKKQNPFNTHSIEQAAEDYIREIDFRMQQRGITSAEAIAEIQAEEQMKEEAAIYVRLVFQLPLTVFVVYKKRKGVLDFISQALQGASFELVSLSEMSDMKALWKRLLSADPQKVWVINEVEQVVDVALQSVIHAMLQRENTLQLDFRLSILELSGWYCWEKPDVCRFALKIFLRLKMRLKSRFDFSN